MLAAFMLSTFSCSSTTFLSPLLLPLSSLSCCCCLTHLALTSPSPLLTLAFPRHCFPLPSRHLDHTVLLLMVFCAGAISSRDLWRSADASPYCSYRHGPNDQRLAAPLSRYREPWKNTTRTSMIWRRAWSGCTTFGAAFLAFSRVSRSVLRS
ncbi:hypothetical protein DAEQUDRAFT_205531 [Daedalea quercina L-15889]|uniref:Secreted protein n=1 Tax=Daedalea quercina L-15889 TaxID=1314783 RepID=A0A165R860_9APHY|nr:hypothetical protein DAEQUDRAFT_205531 [Daedalea quercina L-15889]